MTAIDSEWFMMSSMNVIVILGRMTDARVRLHVVHANSVSKR